MPHLDVAKQWLAAIESNTDAFRFLTDDAVQDEMPNRLFPAGRRNDVAAMRANFEKGKHLLATQRYEIVSALEQGDRVVFELHWRGTLTTGVALEAHVAMFLTFRDGKIAHLRNYDCYPQ